MAQNWFPPLQLGQELTLDLQRLNPWWDGKSLPALPATRRHLVTTIHARLKRRLAPIVVVRGPRQIGKTTAQLQVIQDLLEQGVPNTHILRVQCDQIHGLSIFKEPILRIVDWFEQTVLRASLNDAARANRPAFLFFDEVQNLANWAEQLKFLVDASSTQVVVTGSSALRIGLGRDSLAGRITTIEAGVLSLTEIAQFHGMDLGPPFLEDNGLEPLSRMDFWRDLRSHGERLADLRRPVFQRFAALGGYPLAHNRSDVPWSALADQLNENVIQRVIQHDLRIGSRGRKRDEDLLQQVFRLACRYIGQAPSPDTFAREIQRVMRANVGPQRVRQYLRFLDETLLLRLIQPMEIRLKRRRGNPKICLADHGLRASWLQEIIPLTPEELAKHPELAGIAGHIAESIVGATLSSISHLDLAYSPERDADPEVDFVLITGQWRIPLEVKYQRRLDVFRDTEGLRAFVEKAANNAPFGILVSLDDSVDLPDPRMVSLPLSTLMLLR